MLRKMFGFWLMLLLLGPARALVLEIGEIQVTSALNQLFDARIPLPKLTPEELSKISVKLATQPAFKEFGLDRTRTLSKLVFSVEYNAAGEVYVRVVSTEPIREPSLGLLLEFSWPRGKTIREFTVFLDPVQRLAKQTGDRAKTILDSPAAPSEPVSTPQAATAPVPAPEPTIASAPAPAAEAPASAALPGATTVSSSQPAPLAVALPPATGSMPVATVPEPASVAETPPLTVAATAVPESATLPAPPPLPVEAPPLLIHKPGDSYGPVVAGEGLWKIALKVRPDSGIAPDDMMQALFKANPEAFAKSGIDGLKAGSILRLPTLREIAQFSGSATAKNLAEAEDRTALSSKTAKVNESPTAMPSVTKLPEVAQGGARVFPLTPPAVIEPMMAGTISLEELLAPVKPIQQSAEARVAVLQTSPSRTETVMAPPLLGPVSATPLLYEAVSEVMTSAVKIPGFAIPAQIVPGSIIADRPVAPQAKEAPRIRPLPTTLTVGARQVAKPLATESTLAPLPQINSSPAMVPPTIEPSLVTETVESSATDVAKIGTERLYQGEEHYGPVLLNERLWDIATKVRPDARVRPLATESTLAPLPQINSSPMVAPPTIEPSLVAETVDPSATDTAKIGAGLYQGGGYYGPVLPNERLWDIATKVRPDASIGKDAMMKALVKLNPEAFSLGMDHMKVGASLRIPTLQDIVTHTGSLAAKQLLEQQAMGSTSPNASPPVSTD